MPEIQINCLGKHFYILIWQHLFCLENFKDKINLLFCKCFENVFVFTLPKPCEDNILVQVKLLVVFVSEIENEIKIVFTVGGVIYHMPFPC